MEALAATATSALSVDDLVAQLDLAVEVSRCCEAPASIIVVNESAFNIADAEVVDAQCISIGVRVAVE